MTNALSPGMVWTWAVTRACCAFTPRGVTFAARNRAILTAYTSNRRSVMRMLRQLHGDAIRVAALLSLVMVTGCASGTAAGSGAGAAAGRTGETRSSTPNATRGSASGQDENIREMTRVNSRSAAGTARVPAG